MDHIDAAENLWNSVVQLLSKKTIPNIDLEHFQTHDHPPTRQHKKYDQHLILFKEL